MYCLAKIPINVEKKGVVSYCVREGEGPATWTRNWVKSGKKFIFCLFVWYFKQFFTAQPPPPTLFREATPLVDK